MRPSCRSPGPAPALHRRKAGHGADGGLLVPDSSRLALALATLLYGWLAGRRTSAELALIATFQGYLLLASITLAYLYVPVAPYMALVAALATLVVAPRAPGWSGRVLEPLALVVAFLAPLAGEMAELMGARSLALPPAHPMGSKQLSLLLAAILVGIHGRRRQQKGITAIAIFQLYFLYSWIIADNGITALQMYTVPLAILLFALIRLFPAWRSVLELFSALILLLPATIESVSQPELLYLFLVGIWGLLCLGIGISFSRRLPTVAGSAALLIAALRQLWSVTAALPQWVIVGTVGMILMAAALLLTLRRDTLFRMRDVTVGYWEQLR